MCVMDIMNVLRSGMNMYISRIRIYSYLAMLQENSPNILSDKKYS